MPPRARNPYLGPRQGAHSRGRDASGYVVWGVLLAPYVVFATAVAAAVVANRLGGYDVRETLAEVGGALGAGTMMALLLWPAAYLLERVLRRFRASREGHRNLALWILAFALYVNCSVDVLAPLGVIPREHAVAVAVRGVSAALVFLAVPLFLVWLGLLLFQRRR